MKKISYLLIIILSLFIYTKVYAEKVNIKSIELISKDEDTEVLSDASVDNLSLNINLKFYNVGDYVKYKLVIENKDTEDYIINNKEILDNNKLIKYEFIFDNNDNVLKSNSSKTFYLNVSYTNEISNKLLANNPHYTSNNKIELSLVKDKPTIIENVKEIIENPNTKDNILIIWISIMVVIFISYILIKNKRARYIVIMISLIIPISSRAIEEIKININSDVEIIRTSLAKNCWKYDLENDQTIYIEEEFCVDWEKYFGKYEDFDSEKNISIVTENSRKIPNKYTYNNVEYNLEKTYDVSDLQNGRVNLGVYKDENNNYLGVIGEDNYVIFPKDCTYLFSGGKDTNMNLTYWSDNSVLNYLKNIELDNVYTTNVEDMRGIFYRANNVVKLDISKFDTSNVTSMILSFYEMISLENIEGTENLNTSSVLNMKGMFFDCNSLISLDVSSFDTSKVTDMSYMFRECYNLISLDISSFDTSKVTDMSNMFWQCYTLTSLDVSNFDTSSVTSMGGMFGSKDNFKMAIEEIKGLEKFDTKNVTSMRVMFQDCPKLKELNLNGWDTSNVEDMGWMFHNDESLEKIEGIEQFDTNKVVNMQSTFYGLKAEIHLDLNNWDTSNVTSMRWMFGHSEGIKELHVSNWNVEKVTDMYGAFYLTTLTNIDLSGWNTKSVETTNRMFNAAYYLETLDIRNFDFSKVTNDTYCFSGFRVPTIRIIVKDQEHKDWVLAHNHANLTEDNVVVSS